MTITVNGKQRDVNAGATIASLLTDLRLEIDRVAVEFNRAILPKGNFAETRLSDGDTIEIVHFVGGGSVSRL